MKKIALLPAFCCAALIVACALFLLTPHVSEAHTVTDVGEFQIIAAWEIEPVIVGERNTIVIDIMRNNLPIQSADARMSIEMESNGQRKPVAASPLTTENTLRYTIRFIPTAVGDYLIHLNGRLEGEPLEVTVSPEPTNRADIIQFPDIALSNSELQGGLINVEQRVADAQLRANIGIGVGVAGVLVGFAGVVSGRRQKSSAD